MLPREILDTNLFPELSTRECLKFHGIGLSEELEICAWRYGLSFCTLHLNTHEFITEGLVIRIGEMRKAYKMLFGVAW